MSTGRTPGIDDSVSCVQQTFDDSSLQIVSSVGTIKGIDVGLTVCTGRDAVSGDHGGLGGPHIAMFSAARILIVEVEEDPVLRDTYEFR